MKYGGVDLSGSSYGLRVVQSDLPLRSPVDTRIVEFSRVGGTHGLARIGVRTITVSVLVSGSSSADLIAKIDALNAVLDPDMDKAIIFDHMSDRYWMVRHAGDAIAAPPLGLSSIQFDLSFVAADPYGYSTTETVHTLTDGDSDGIITTTITPGGSAEAEPVYVLSPPPSTATMISNNATGQTLYIEHSAGQLVKFDASFMATYPVYTSTDGGTTWIPAPEIVSGNYYNMRLKPNVANALTIWASSATITYRARYL